MNDSDITSLQQAIQERWGKASGLKVTQYVDKFWDRQRQERRSTAVVQHFTAVKSSELRNRHFHELGAIKLAVL